MIFFGDIHSLVVTQIIVTFQTFSSVIFIQIVRPFLHLYSLTHHYSLVSMTFIQIFRLFHQWYLFFGCNTYHCDFSGFFFSDIHLHTKPPPPNGSRHGFLWQPRFLLETSSQLRRSKVGQHCGGWWWWWFLWGLCWWWLEVKGPSYLKLVFYGKYSTESTWKVRKVFYGKVKPHPF